MTRATQSTDTPDRSDAAAWPILVGLFFVSGAASLVLQVLWMYRLGLVFGNAAHAAAATLSSFFLGLALGGWFWGGRADGLRRTLRAYGLIELGIAVGAVVWLAGLDLYEAVYPALLDPLDSSGFATTGIKLALATPLLLIPTFFMGGTFPLMAHHVTRVAPDLARRGTLLYAANTLGAALGAGLAGFYLLRTFGVHRSYVAAVTSIAAVGVTAIVLDRFQVAGSVRPDDGAPAPGGAPERAPPGDLPSRSMVYALAAASGFLTLAIEALWTRMFAQVLQNSVYSFSVVLVVFLASLGVGGAMAHVLVRTRIEPVRVLGGLLTLAALGVGLSPLAFGAVTDDLTYIAADATWSGYVKAMFWNASIVLLPPAVVMGSIFPFLLKGIHADRDPAGHLVGRLVLLNSLGAALGPFLAAFVLLHTLGLWTSVKVVALLYAALAVLVMRRSGVSIIAPRFALPLAALLVVAVAPTPPLVRLEAGEELLGAWQGSDGIVSVVRRGSGIEMRLDNNYVLGDSHSALVEQMQGHIPLLLHAEPSRVLFLGLGTGLTAGAALSHDVEKVVAIELVSNVVRAADRFFTRWTNGLFGDERVSIVTDDARSFLLASGDRFDVIVGDLYTPWHAGTGSLYTVEHFLLARDHLAEGGIFVQWLPLYQLTPDGFATIAATFQSVFPHTTVWRADFSAARPIVALVGQEAGARLDPSVLADNSRYLTGEPTDGETDHMAALFYVGNLGRAQSLVGDTRINTDDRRTLELRAPVASQEAGGGRDGFIVHDAAEELFSALRRAVPTDGDPYLAALPIREARYADAGLLYFRFLRYGNRQASPERAAVLARLREVAPAFAAVLEADLGR